MTKRRRWTSNELIAALELYSRFKPSQISKQDAQIVGLARLMDRSQNAVYMKLCNFLSLDPKYTGYGLTHVGRADREIWRKFASRRAALQTAARNARRSLARQQT